MQRLFKARYGQAIAVFAFALVHFNIGSETAESDAVSRPRCIAVPILKIPIPHHPAGRQPRGIKNNRKSRRRVGAGIRTVVREIPGIGSAGIAECNATAIILSNTSNSRYASIQAA